MTCRYIVSIEINSSRRRMINTFLHFQVYRKTLCKNCGKTFSSWILNYLFLCCVLITNEFQNCEGSGGMKNCCNGKAYANIYVFFMFMFLIQWMMRVLPSKSSRKRNLKGLDLEKFEKSKTRVGETSLSNFFCINVNGIT